MRLRGSIAISLMCHLLALFLLSAQGVGWADAQEVFMVRLYKAGTSTASVSGAASPQGGPHTGGEARTPFKAMPVKETVAEVKAPVAIKAPEALSDDAASVEVPEAEDHTPLPESEAAYAVTLEGPTGPLETEYIGDGSAIGGHAAALEDGITGGGPAGQNGGIDPWVLSSIKDAIQRAVTYPPLARKRKIEGTVLASFHIDGTGMPGQIRVLRSSGYGVLDKETVRIIRRASPYPPLGAKVEVPVSFRLLD